MQARNETPILPVLLACLAVPALAALTAQAQEDDDQAQPRPRILVTNDDGWDAPGLKAVVAALAEVGEVVVCAPSDNRSGASHSTEVLGGEHEARPTQVEGAAQAWAVEGTPSDSVSFGVLGLGAERGFDLVVSGINSGPNVGEVAHYSGTVGAGMEAVGLGVAAIAVSQSDRRDYEPAARFTARLARKLLSEGAAPGVLLSVNVPSFEGDGDETQPVVVAPMGGRFLKLRGFSNKEQDDGSLRFRARLGFNRDAPEGSDTAAFLSGAITVTPLRFDWTDSAELERVAGWGLGEER